MKRKLNWIDYTIIIIILGVLFVLGTKVRNFIPQKTTVENNTQSSKREVVLKIEDVRKYSVDSIKAGENIYSDDTNYLFGKIKDIEIEDSYLILVKNNGEVVETRSPERYNIILTVDCNVLDRTNGYYSEGITEIKVNSTGKYKTIGLLFTATVQSIGE
ncbi:MAG: DUF4330 domain-containing protein [Tissierellaceae bacterium]|nr:DUF4330 domain-containing protein [Tissierellaceae bacterium]